MNRFFTLLFLIAACQSQPKSIISEWKPFNEESMIESVSNHKNPRMHYQLIQSKISDKNDIWKKVSEDLSDFGEEDYMRLYDLIYEQDILSIQNSIYNEDLNYKQLTQWYIYRIIKYENDSTTTLNTVIALNPEAVKEAEIKDRRKGTKDHPIYGIPILLKDNINMTNIPTTAGAAILANNMATDAFIVRQMKQKGAIILGKVNLSEWAYFFCDGCPVGYSAIGGQTLNPYGRAIFETGGSSSGSGTSVAANYAAAAIGTETSGSILSPSGQNSVVGLKPTIGLLSRSGIVPISSTLDTPGPMTKNVSDNVILLDAMNGEDEKDNKTSTIDHSIDYLGQFKDGKLNGIRLGVMKRFLSDTLYRQNVDLLKNNGAEIVIYDPPSESMQGFLTLLTAEMKRDLPIYLKQSSSIADDIDNVEDIVEYNLLDSIIRSPYGQARLDGIVSDTTSDYQLAKINKRLQIEGRKYLGDPIRDYGLDAILSVNNRSAGYAAVAQYPCLTIPMGYEEHGEPKNMTFIGKPQNELLLYQIGLEFERIAKARKPPF